MIGLCSRPGLVTLVATLVVTLGLAGCTAPVDQTGAPADPTMSKSILRVGATANYPPVVSSEGGSVVGIEPDLAEEIGRLRRGEPVKTARLRERRALPWVTAAVGVGLLALGGWVLTGSDDAPARAAASSATGRSASAGKSARTSTTAPSESPAGSGAGP